MGVPRAESSPALMGVIDEAVEGSVVRSSFGTESESMMYSHHSFNKSPVLSEASFPAVGDDIEQCRQNSSAAMLSDTDPGQAADSTSGSETWRSRAVGRLMKRWPHVGYAAEIGKGSPWELAFHLATVTATPIAYMTLSYAIALSGWAAGIAGLVLQLGATYYSAMLGATLHQTVVIRHCRYRDLARSIYGRQGYNVVFVLQQLGSLGNNVTLQLGCALIMKAIYLTLRPTGGMTVHAFIAIFGAFQLVLSQLPTIHELRHLNAVATVVAGTVTGLLVAGCISNAADSIPPNRFDPPGKGDPKKIAMQALSSFGIISFSLCNILQPELQSVVRAPAVRNGRIGVTGSFGYVAIMYIMVAVAGYWVYGNTVNPLLVISMFPRNGWLVLTAELLAIFHGLFNFQIFARCTYEVVDYLLLDPRDDNLVSPKNCLARLVGTTVYLLAVSFLSAMLPNALPNITVIAGSLCYIPLDIIFPLLAWCAVKKPSSLVRFTHYGMSIFWALVGIASVTGSIYNLVNLKSFEAFADTFP
mmetsp:Transcript_18977/g.57315  ORF Transcript_18977/g.57315 Transcript_18977/m.57315 type:complete len:529 (-) Transcript_18977:969-2555(-)